jgi:hypothetical protein
VDAFDHQHRDAGPLKQGRHFAGQAGEGQGSHRFRASQGLEWVLEGRQQLAHQGISVQQAFEAMALDRGKRSRS